MIRPVWYQISHVSETPCNSHHQVRMILGESSPIEEHFFIQTHPRNKNYLCIKAVFVLMYSMYRISTTRKTWNESNPSQNSCWNQKNPKDLNFSAPDTNSQWWQCPSYKPNGLGNHPWLLRSLRFNNQHVATKSYKIYIPLQTETPYQSSIKIYLNRFKLGRHSHHFSSWLFPMSELGKSQKPAPSSFFSMYCLKLVQSMWT